MATRKSGPLRRGGSSAARQTGAQERRSSAKKPGAQKRRPSAKRQQERADARMHTFVLGIAVFLALCAINLIGQTNEAVAPTPESSVTYQVGDPESFFEALGPIVEQYADYGIYPSVMLAQAAVESNYGASQLSFDYNNYFGIKAHGSHRSVLLTTTEYYGGSAASVHDYFCVYNSPEDCFNDYVDLLTSNDHFSGAVEAASPAIAARALQEGGYATDPNYASTLISIINEYNLSRFDPLTRPEAQHDISEDLDNDTEEDT